MPAVTICIPTYQPKPEHLKAALDSLLAQTFTDWELVIHDDASKVDVEAMVKPYLSDARVRFFRSPTNLGIGGNWNASMQKGLAPVVAYLFQDDLWNPEYLKRCMAVFDSEPTVGFTAANHAYRIEGAMSPVSTGTVARERRATGIYKEVSDLRAAEMKTGRLERDGFLRMWIERGLRPNLLGEPSFVMLRRELMQKVGPFNETMRQGLDAEYWVRCLLHADCYWIADNLGDFRVHPSATTARNEESGTGRTDRLKTFNILIRAMPAGPMKGFAKSVRRRELWKMIKRFLVSKLQRR